MEYFSHKYISEKIISITDITNVHMFLVLGTRRAALIDTGTGVGNLRKYVEKLTDLPLTVIVTHGHCDHAGGAALFDEVYLPEEDFELVKVHASMPRKIEYIQFSGGKDVPEKDITGVREAPYTPLKDGMTFDLGDESLEIVKIPGHTQGMSGILFPKERYLLMGDGCNPGTFVWDEEALTITEYLESLKHLKLRENEYDKVILSHGEEFCTKDVLDASIHVCQEVIKREDDAVPFQFLNYEGLRMAKAVDPVTFQRADGGFGNIVYHINKI